ncbi:carboxypeptidase regulatory-like domain-containing protein [Paenibacillus athensensis]|nr:carboxypeptidase regulatory-like domain-containing protein [Paenibacillus athensensis]MCD1260105.1 carboxypeptidase regulatory-like domain-containing protein [Paenibacillus athensensis]
MKKRVQPKAAWLLAASICASLWTAGGSAGAVVITGPVIVSPLLPQVTHDSEPQVRVAAPAGSMVTVYEGATVLGSGTSDGEHPLTIALQHLNDGVHNLVAKMTINGEDAGQTAFPALIVDADAPFTIVDATALTTQLEMQSWDFSSAYAGEDPGTPLIYRNAKFLLRQIEPLKVIAPILPFGVQPGSVPGSAKVVTDQSRLYYVASSSPLPTPEMRSALPAGAVSYTAGGDIEGLDPIQVKYLGLYAVNSSGQVVAFSAVELSPQQIAGSIYGRVRDDLDNGAVSGMTLRFRAGADNHDGDVLAEAVTDGDGVYSISLPAGTYTVEMSKLGYVSSFVTRSLVFSEEPQESNQLIAVRAPEGEDTRIVLTWGSTPRDLDSHLIGPTPDDGSFHIYYGHKQYDYQGANYATLDLDDTSGEGPETTTLASVTQQVYGTYTFYVKNYSFEERLAASGAKVEVYQGSAVTPTYVFNVPASAGNERYWHVFDLNVSPSGSQVITRNELVDSEPQFVPGSMGVGADSMTALSSLSGATPDGVTVELADNDTQGLTVDDFSVTASIYNSVSEETVDYKLTGLAYNPATRRLTFDTIPVGMNDTVTLQVQPSASSQHVESGRVDTQLPPG